MATGKRPPSAIPGSRRKRPAPTIDLKATELAVEATAASAPPQPEPEPAVAAAPPPVTPPSPQEPPPEPPPEAPRAASAPPPGGIAWLPPEFPWPAAIAGALGAAAVLTVFLAVWLLLPRGDATAALSPRLASIETQLRELAARPAPAAIDPQAIEALSQRLAKLETAVAAPRPPVADPALANRIGALDNAFKPVPDALSALARRADQIDAGLRDMRGRIDTMAATMATTISETQSTARIASGDHGEIVKLSERIAGLETSNRTLTEQLGKNAAIVYSDRSARLALAATALRSAVERGEPLVAELAAVKPLVSDPASIAPLEPFAASGVPSAAALGRELLPLLPVMQRAAGTVTRDGGLLDRLQANAERLVRVRPVQEVPGEDANAVLSRIEVKAAHADIGGALAELAKLQPSVRAPALAWIARAEGRNKAVEASRRLAADAVAALKPTP